ncbi:hypothetical protein BKA62DRAFT_697165, partial [Auriculariales sp. MPI-PUGE-AT-0066]
DDMWIAFTTVLAALLTVVSASPVGMEKRVVYDPTVTYPHKATVWKLGARHNVTWDTSDAPSSISNRASVWLRKDETTLYDYPLGEGFDLHVGRYEIIVPKNLATGSDYRIHLYGDSGNFVRAQYFTITK